MSVKSGLALTVAVSVVLLMVTTPFGYAISYSAIAIELTEGNTAYSSGALSEAILGQRDVYPYKNNGALSNTTTLTDSIWMPETTSKLTLRAFGGTAGLFGSVTVQLELLFKD